MEVVAGSGLGLKDFPYTIGEPYASAATSGGSWTHHRGTSKDDGSAVSIFSLSGSNPQDRHMVACRNGLKKLQTVRHPNVLSFLHITEAEVLDGPSVKHTIYIVTEPVIPFSKLKELNLGGTQSNEYFAWGLHQISKAVSFLNNDRNLVHGNVCLASLVVTQSLDWKLHAFDSLSEFDANNEASGSPMLQLEWLVGTQYKPMELRKSDWASIRKSPPWAIDSWGLGCLIYELFSGAKLARTEDLQNTTSIPKSLLPVYQRLLNLTPFHRLNPSRLVDNNEFFQNKLVETLQFMEALDYKDNIEKDSFFQKLPDIAEQLPREIVLKKLLPVLATSLELDSAAATALSALLKLGSWLPADQFSIKVLPTIVKLFASNDRAIRVCLLQNIIQFEESLSAQTVDEQVYPLVATGFSDASVSIRKLTLKSMLVLVPKLSQSTISSSLSKYLSELLVDEDSGIRIKTAIFLGNTAKEHIFTEDELERLLVYWIDNPNTGDPLTVVQVGDLYQVEELLQNGNGEFYFLTELEQLPNGKFKRTYNGYNWHYIKIIKGTLTDMVHYQVRRKTQVVHGLTVIIFTKKGGPKEKVLIKIEVTRCEVLEVDEDYKQVQELNVEPVKDFDDESLLQQKYDALLSEKEVFEAQMNQKYNKLLLEKEQLEVQYTKLEVKYKHQENKLFQISKENRDLHNTVLELKGNVRVICRCRPFHDEEIKRGLAIGIKFDSENAMVTIKDSNKTFKFDGLCKPEEKQESVFEKVLPLVTSALDGYNVCIFAYGQTGTGKTYTVEGVEGAPGLTFRMLEKIFNIIEERRMMFHYEYEVHISVKEIYNEVVQVLCGDEIVTNIEEAWGFMKEGISLRVTHATNANEHSSRSHCVQCITIKLKESGGSWKEGKLSIVDLAGSERCTKTGAEGERLTEANCINKSLMELGIVISALAEKAQYIPVRNSKLTLLLKDALCVGSKVLMLAQISPNPDDMSETLSTLNFASGVRKVELGQARQRSTPCKPTDKPAPASKSLQQIPEGRTLSCSKMGYQGPKSKVMVPRKASGGVALQASKSVLRAAQASKSDQHNDHLLSPLIGRCNRLLSTPQAGGKAGGESSCLRAVRETPIVDTLVYSSQLMQH